MTHSIRYAVVSAAVLVATLATSALAQPLGSAFTYQGRITFEGTPITDTSDLSFSLWTAQTGGSPVGSPVLTTLTPADGLFTATLDFGASALNGDARWLQIDVRTPSGIGVYTTLTPRQSVSPAPYAVQTRGIHVDTANKVGIGTTSPQSPLHVVGNSGALALEGTDHTYLELFPDGLAAGRKAYFGFANGASDNLVLRNQTATGHIILGMNGNVGIGLGDNGVPGAKLDIGGDVRMTGLRLVGNGAAAGRVLTSDASGIASWQVASGSSQWTTNGNNIGYNAGNVGIGTTNPMSPLSFPNVPGDKIRLWGSVGNHFGMGIQNSLLQIYSDSSSSDIAFGWGASGSFNEKMRIGGDGNVGIGTTNPTAALHVLSLARDVGIMASAAVDGTWLQLLNSSAGGKQWQFISTGSGNGEGAGKLLIRNGSEQTVAMAIAPDGNVGIGTNHPEQKLHVNGPIRMQNGVNRLDLTSGAALDVIASTDLYVNTPAGNRILMQTNGGSVGIGTNNPQARLDVAGIARVDTLQIDAGADVAENYDIAPSLSDKSIAPKPGMVVSIDPAQIGKLIVTDRAYDRRVAGIVSGAGDVKPGLVLAQPGTVADGEFPVASMGRVWCLVDADAGGPVGAGDLLTTAATPGHAMRVGDASRAPGATIGKAMSSLKEGRGLVLVLVSLQ